MGLHVRIEYLIFYGWRLRDRMSSEIFTNVFRILLEPETLGLDCHKTFANFIAYITTIHVFFYMVLTIIHIMDTTFSFIFPSLICTQVKSWHFTVSFFFTLYFANTVISDIVQVCLSLFNNNTQAVFDIQSYYSIAVYLQVSQEVNIKLVFF